MAVFAKKSGGNVNPIYASKPSFVGGINTTPIEQSISRVDDMVSTIPKKFKRTLIFNKF